MYFEEEKIERQNIITSAMKSLYVRYQQSFPREDYWNQLLRCCEKDFEPIPTKDLIPMFKNAYSKHDGMKVPSIKQILGYWQALGMKQVLFKQACKKCQATGFISTIDTKSAIKYSTAFRCDCSNGQLVCLNVQLYSDQWRDKGYIPFLEMKNAY